MADQKLMRTERKKEKIGKAEKVYIALKRAAAREAARKKVSA